MHVNPEVRSRLLEILVAVAASVVTSALAVTWSLSHTLATFEQRFAESDGKFAEIRSTLQGTQMVDAAQTSQLAVSEAHYEETIRRLTSIETKLDRRLR